MTNTLSAPDMDTSSDGSVIYVSCHTGNGTGAAASEQYAFEIVDNQMEPYYVDINDLADRPGDRIAISYDAGKNAAAIFADDEKILTDDLTSIGTADSESVVPDSFYCGDQISLEKSRTVQNVNTQNLQLKQPGLWRPDDTWPAGGRRG